MKSRRLQKNSKVSHVVELLESLASKETTSAVARRDFSNSLDAATLTAVFQDTD